MSMAKAVVLLSGGLDSAVALYLAKSNGFDVVALSFDYGQQHSRELIAAKAIAENAEVLKHQVVSINMNSWGGSSLTDENLNIEDGDVNRTDIPITYVSARNMIFLSVAASVAEVHSAQDIFIGVSEVDYSGYVDCRQEFIDAMEKAVNLGTVMGAEQNLPIKIHAPFANMTKAKEIELGMKLGVDFNLTWSCYRGGEKPCGSCDSCLLRAKAFKEAGFEDPALK